MPQLEQIDTFASQIFWLFVAFGIIYFMLSKIFLPEVSEVINKRADIISSDIILAEKLKDEAAFIQKEYNKLIVQAKSDSSEITSKALKEAANTTSEEQHKIDAELAAKVSSAEAEIISSKNASLKELETTLVSELAQKITNELGLNVDKQQIESAVASVKQ